MQSSLRRTWIALAVALVALVPLAGVAALRLVDDVYPLCRGDLAEIGPRQVFTEERVTWGEPVGRNGARFELRYAEKPTRFGGTAVRDVRVVRTDCGVPDATCGTIRLPVLDGNGWPDVVLVYGTDNEVYYAGSASGRSVYATFREVDRPTRHLQRDRLFAPRRVPDLVVLVAFLALAVAALRARLAIAYATRVHRWTSLILRPDGVLTNEDGATAAMLESQARRLRPGPVLVDPSVLGTGSIYRELPIVHRRQIAAGSHERWQKGTLVRLRDARALAAISVACTALAVLARVVG